MKTKIKSEKKIIRIMVSIIIFGILLYNYNMHFQPVIENFWICLFGKLLYFFCSIYIIGTLFIHWKSSAFINEKYKWVLFTFTIIASFFYLLGFLFYYIFVYELKFGIIKKEEEQYNNTYIDTRK